MNFQKLLLSKPKLAKRVLSALPESYWVKESEKTALRVFNVSKKRVPAYKKFLEQFGVDDIEVKNLNNFLNLPIMSKHDYIMKHDLEELCLDGRLWDKYTVEKSSGHSSKSFYWPRTMENDELIPSLVEFALFQSHHINQHKTLLIITYALGTWTTGEKAADAVRKIAASGKYEMTAVTPGANLREVIELLEDLSPKYEQTIVMGYPPFIKSMIDEATRKNIDLPRLNIKIGLGGECHSEHWREHVAHKIGARENDIFRIASAYGAADVGIGVGNEYPLTILVRKLAMRDGKLAKALFGESSVLPGLYQSNSSVFIEEIAGELVFTALNGIPVVRYNLHDKGGILPFGRVVNLCREHGYDLKKLLAKAGYDIRDAFKLPMFYVFGRSDGTISVMGANIYPENIEQAIIDTKYFDLIHSFKMGMDFDDQQNARPVIYFELNESDFFHDEETIRVMEVELHDLVLEKLLAINHDFEDGYKENPESSNPIIKIFNKNSGVFVEDKGIKRRYIIK